MRTQHFRLGLGVVGLAFGLAVACTGCDYSAPVTPGGSTPVGTYERGYGLSPDAAETRGASPGASDTDVLPEQDKGVILANVLELIRTAALKPGGNNFAIATRNLNQYFSDKRPSDFALNSAARAYLLEQMPAGAVKDLENPSFRMPDARHLEDCMLYHTIAARIGGTGTELDQVRRVFRWIVEQIQLVPEGSLAPPGLQQAYTRPYDVLMRGMATEAEGFWAERGWLFMVLCRQLGVDVGLLTYTPPGGKEPVVWTCAALLDGRLYLFDTRIGMEVPGPGGSGVATLDDALRDPTVLAALDLPGQSPYGTNRDVLRGSASKIGVLIDSSPDYRSPRMALLQKDLAGKNRTILYRDPAVERDRFVEALGDRAGTVGFWMLPAMVETLLFSSPQFVQATQHAQLLFDPNHYPLVYARIKQLRGEIPAAMEGYVKFRLVDTPLEVDQKTPIPAEIQQALDIYATYFLGLCHLEQGNPDKARPFFERTLQMLPEPGRGQPYYHMFRWGAQANLGRLCEARGDVARAIAYYSQADPTAQRHGNLLRARALVWRDPTAPPAPDLPPAPPAPAPAPPPMLAAPPAK